MSTSWDTICKVLVRNHPHALLRLFGPSLTFIQPRPTELKEVERRIDSLLEVVSHGQRLMLHIEFQASNDPTMAERLLEYNVLIRRQLQLPVLSCVLYLLPHDSVPTSPLRWDVPGRSDVLTFTFESLQVAHLLSQELIDLDSVELLTLLPLTQDGANQHMLDYMLETLRQHGNKDLQVIGLAFATLAVRKDAATSTWLKRRIKMMEDMLDDIPLFHDIQEKAFNEGMQQGEQRGEQRGKQQGEIASSQKLIVGIVKQRFPALLKLAQQQAESIEDPQTLQSIVLLLAIASTEEQARDALISWLR